MKTILIVPLGVNVDRVTKSIFRSGASKVYLISTKAKLYEEFIKNKIPLLDDLKSFTDIVKLDTAHFTDIADIYRSFTKALFVAKDENPDSKILFDITSTTKEAVIAACVIAQSEGLKVTYVPRTDLEDLKQMKNRYEKGPETIQDKGVERLVFELPKAKLPPIADDEICMLTKILDSVETKSMQEVLKSIQKNDKMKKSTRYWIRMLHRLEDRNLVRLKTEGKIKKISVTPEGKGTIIGIKEAYEYSKSRQEGKLASKIFQPLEKDILSMKAG